MFDIFHVLLYFNPVDLKKKKKKTDIVKFKHRLCKYMNANASSMCALIECSV